jgi:hypothetical protein
MSERVAIVGTAPSWKLTPWNDPGLKILGLNDAYRLGWPRADGWYDIHPISKFYHAPNGQQIFAHQVPVGHYVRPADHVEWMAKQTIPIWLHDAPPAGWNHARQFPKQEIEAAFGCYMTSTPGWMLAHVILQGAKEIHIYGIHLATESEYIEQRPNFEFLIGRALGPGKIKLIEADGLRTYETEDAKVVLPSDSPILQSNFQYAYDTRPNAKLEPVKWEMHKLQIKHQRTVQALKQRPWYKPVAKLVEPGDDGKPRTRICSTSTLQSELWYLEAAMEDTRQQLQRLQMGT